jgi:23S rRNA (uracil1939-C5)-methyltransferase
LTRIGKIESPPVHPAVPSPASWNYRNQVQFHLTTEGRLGFQGQRSHQVVPIRECHLPEDSLNQLWPVLDLEPIPGLDRLVLRVGAGDEALLVLESSDPEPVSLLVDLPVSVVHSGPGGTLVLAGEETLVQEVLGRPFQVSAGSFFQVNTPMAAAMVNHLLDNLDLSPEMTLVDAYCGVGLFSAFLASRVKRLVAIESSPSACDDFVTNLDEFDHVELYEAPVAEVLPALDLKADIILVDPPRAGLDRLALDSIISLRPETLAYISCDPATLARDAHRLVQGGYRLSQITPFDLFPQTFHIESISFWHKD